MLKHRAFLKLWFAKPMVRMWLAFHENDRYHENDKNEEETSDSYKEGVECWLSRNHGKGCKPRLAQTTGLLEIPEKHATKRYQFCQQVLNPTPTTCHKRKQKLRCNFRKVALQHSRFCCADIMFSHKLRCNKRKTALQLPATFLLISGSHV